MDFPPGLPLCYPYLFCCLLLALLKTNTFLFITHTHNLLSLFSAPSGVTRTRTNESPGHAHLFLVACARAFFIPYEFRIWHSWGSRNGHVYLAPTGTMTLSICYPPLHCSPTRYISEEDGEGTTPKSSAQVGEASSLRRLLLFFHDTT